MNQSAAALSGSFAPTDRFENLEIRKGFLQVPSLNSGQNPSLTALVISSKIPWIFDISECLILFYHITGILART